MSSWIIMVKGQGGVTEGHTDRLTHWGQVTHICVGNLIIIGSYNGLSASQWQAIIWTDAAILLIRTLGTNINEVLNKIHTFSFKKTHWKMLSAKWQQFCLSLNMLRDGHDIQLPCELPTLCEGNALITRFASDLGHHQAHVMLLIADIFWQMVMLMRKNFGQGWSRVQNIYIHKYIG